jgi:hypothetical protein
VAGRSQSGERLATARGPQAGGSRSFPPGPFAFLLRLCQPCGSPKVFIPPMFCLFRKPCGVLFLRLFAPRWQHTIHSRVRNRLTQVFVRVRDHQVDHVTIVGARS